MEDEIRVTLTKDVFDRRLKEYMRPYLESYAFYVGVPAVTLLLCLATGEFVKNSAGTLILGVLLGCCLTQIAFYLYQYRSSSRTYMAEAEQWYGQELLYELNEDGIATTSMWGRQILPWHSVKKLRAGSTEWFLGSYATQMLGLPVELLNEEVKQFIKRKVVDAGGEVLNK